MAKYTLRKPRKKKARKLSPREQSIQEAINNWEELGKGLSIPEQLALARKCRGVGKLPKAFLSQMIPPTKELMRNLALHCSRAIVNRNGNKHRSDRIFVLVRLAYNYRQYERSLPLGDIVEVGILNNVFRINANLLLDWLYKKGYVDYDSRMLRRSLGSVTKMLTDWEKEFPIINKYSPDFVIVGAWENIVKNLVDEMD